MNDDDIRRAGDRLADVLVYIACLLVGLSVYAALHGSWGWVITFALVAVAAFAVPAIWREYSDPIRRALRDLDRDN